MINCSYKIWNFSLLQTPANKVYTYIHTTASRIFLRQYDFLRPIRFSLKLYKFEWRCDTNFARLSLHLNSRVYSDFVAFDGSFVGSEINCVDTRVAFVTTPDPPLHFNYALLYGQLDQFTNIFTAKISRGTSCRFRINAYWFRVIPRIRPR